MPGVCLNLTRQRSDAFHQKRKTSGPKGDFHFKKAAIIIA
jgi:hypothetical protein